MNTYNFRLNPNPKIKINLHKTLTLALTLTLVIVGLMTSISQALPAIQIIQTPEIEQIDINSKKEIKTTIEELNKVDPQKLTITKLEKKSKGEVISNNNNLKVSIKSDKTISMDNGKNKINLKVTNGDIRIPSKSDIQADFKGVLVDNKIIYEGTKVDTIVEAIDGGIRQIINIKDKIAPKVYNFPMELKQGETIRINQDGSANVMNNKNESITTILKPWAKDATGKDIKTFYTVDKNILQQHIETNDMTKYPVKADPTWCGRTYNSIKWIIRESFWSLSIIPSWCGRSMMAVGTIFTSNYFLRTPISQLPNYWLAESSFQDIAWNTPWHYQWPWGHKSKDDNSPIYRSMFKQYYCHMVGAFYKDEWNLEPWRGDRPMTTVFTGFQGWNAPKIFIPCNH